VIIDYPLRRLVKGFQVRVTVNRHGENWQPVVLRSRCVTTASESTDTIVSLKIEVALDCVAGYMGVQLGCEVRLTLKVVSSVVTANQTEHLNHVQLFYISSLQLNERRTSARCDEDKVADAHTATEA
jgi:hypothetical protein